MKVLKGYGWEAAGATGMGAIVLTLAGIPEVVLQMIAVTGFGILAWNTTARSMLRGWAKTLKAEKVEVWVRNETIETLRNYDVGVKEGFEDVHAKLGSTPLTKREQDAASVVYRALEWGALRAREQARGEELQDRPDDSKAAVQTAA